MKFLMMHPLEPGTTRERLEEMAAGFPPEIRDLHSFVNLTEGKAVCVFEAPNRRFVANWMDEHHLAYDAIWPVEVECNEGEFIELPAGAGMTG